MQQGGGGEMKRVHISTLVAPVAVGSRWGWGSWMGSESFNSLCVTCLAVKFGLKEFFCCHVSQPSKCEVLAWSIRAFCSAFNFCVEVVKSSHSDPVSSVPRSRCWCRTATRDEV